VLNILAVSSIVQLAGGALENAKPGNEGITTSKDTPDCDALDFVVNGSIIGRNSIKDPGHPWFSMRGIALGSPDFLWMKWTVRPSILVVNCGYLFVKYQL
jgi:hypothetical protein